MQSHYEINVSKRFVSTLGGTDRYIHLFATAPRSCVDLAEATAVYKEIKAKFPEPDYQVTTTYQKCVGMNWTPVT